MKRTLPASELAVLRAEHRRARDRRAAYRLNVVILLGMGWSAREVAEALLIDEETARDYFKRYREGGIEKLLRAHYQGSAGLLDDDQLMELQAHLQGHLYLKARDLAGYVQERFGVRYGERGMTALLHRLGYVYKKPKLVPGKADAKAQEAFLQQYQELKQAKAADEPIYFLDATHPQHNPVLGYGWIKRGRERAVRSNSGRQRLNINGAIEVQSLSAVVRFDETINAASTVALLTQLEQAHPGGGRIHVICDNAGYYRSKAVQDYLQDARINLIFLPPYSPNLNLIERFWKFFKKQVLYNRYYETFAEFRRGCERFFSQLDQHADSLRSLLTENFAIVNY